MPLQLFLEWKFDHFVFAIQNNFYHYSIFLQIHPCKFRIFFGYTKDKNGEIMNPRLVYYDGEVKWTIDGTTSGLVAETSQSEEVEVRLKQQGEREEAEL